MAALDDKQTGTIVYVLGAGCSKDCGAPVMAEFMDSVQRLAYTQENLMQEDYHVLLQFREECRRASSILHRSWSDIEELYTQAHLAQLVGEPDAGRIVKSIGRVIWDVYRRPHVTENQGYSKFADYLRDRARAWAKHHGPRPVVVTTNYDVALEATLLRSLRPIVYSGSIGIEGKEFGTRPKQWEVDWRSNIPFEIIKLHGSVNWFERGTGVHCRGNLHNDDGVRTFAFQSDVPPEIVRGEDNAVIIPPMLGKSALKPLISQNWQQAVRAFEHARLIVVIGYSFPETDLFMTRLLSQGVMSNKLLEAVVVANLTEESAWWARIEQFFARSWTESGRLIFNKVARFDVIAEQLYSIWLHSLRGPQPTVDLELSLFKRLAPN